MSDEITFSPRRGIPQACSRCLAQVAPEDHAGHQAWHDELTGLFGRIAYYLGQVLSLLRGGQPVRVDLGPDGPEPMLRSSSSS